jgi:RecA-family ATPase
LIVIDPITAYLAGIDSHINADVRAVLAPLGQLAARHSVAVVCVSHLNKGGAASGGSGDALLRVSGSLAFVAAPRAAFIVARDPENRARRLFLPAKNNLGRDGTGLAFSV